MKKKDKLRVPLVFIFLGLIVVSHFMEWFILSYFFAVLMGMVLSIMIMDNLKELEQYSDVRLEAMGQIGKETYGNIRKNKKKNSKKSKPKSNG
jgi:hypothetical protein